MGLLFVKNFGVSFPSFFFLFLPFPSFHFHFHAFSVHQRENSLCASLPSFSMFHVVELWPVLVVVVATSMTCFR